MLSFFAPALIYGATSDRGENDLAWSLTIGTWKSKVPNEMGAHYLRLYSDSSGESHVVDEEVALEPTNFAPPAAPLELSRFIAARQFAFLMVRAGWYGGWHPAPRKQFLIVLTGKIECQASDGETRLLNPGDVLLLEDTVGKGHFVRSTSGDALIAVVQLADSQTD